MVLYTVSESIETASSKWAFEMNLINFKSSILKSENKPSQSQESNDVW